MTDAILKIKVDSSGAVTATKSLDQLSASARKADGETEQLSKTQTTLANAAKFAAGALGALVTSFGVQQVIRYADAWQNATNQLKTVQRETENLTDTHNMLMAVANESRAGFETTANLYTRLARSTESLNLTQGELIDLTETINKSFAVSGASAQEASNAIIQLSQGLAAGALRGEEFNSVSEQSPILMQAIADSLNMTRGELRAFAAEGGITAEIVVNALQEASGKIENTFSKMMATPMQQMTVARNNLLEFFGSSELLQNSLRVGGGAIVAATEFLVSFGQETAQNAEFQRLFNQTLRDGQTDLNDYSEVISQVLQVTNSLLEGKRELVKIQLAENAVVTNNKELIEAAYNLLGEGARQTARQTQLTEGLTMAETLRNSVLQAANELMGEKNEATTESARRTAEEIAALRKQAVALDHGRFSTEAQRQAVDELMQSITVINTSYDRWIPLLSETQWRMQGVTDAVQSNQRATEFWTKVAEDGAKRRSKAEEDAARVAQDNWQRTHEFVTTTILDIADNGGSAFERLGDIAVATAKRIAAEWLALKAMNLFGISLPGGGSGGGGVGGSVMQSVIGKGASALGSAISGGYATGGISGAISGGVGAVGSALGAIPGWGWALGGAALIASQLDKSTPSGNAGFLIRDTAGAAGRTFDVPAFESGFTPVGFARREDQSAAVAVIDTFRQYDAALTRIAQSAGLNVHMSDMSFGGYDENAQGNGLFFGGASEGGRAQGVPIEQQLTQYTKQWVNALGGQISAEQRAELLASGSADELIKKAAQMAGLDGSHANGLSRVPFNGYRAELHRGEEVLRANDPRNQNNQQGMMTEMREMLAEMRTMAFYTKKTSDLLLRVTRDGDSLVTVTA